MKKLLVVVDMQNDFITGSLGTPEAQAIIPAVIAKIQEYKRAGHDIIFTQDTHDENYLETQEGKFLPVVHCVAGSYGWKFCKDIKDKINLKKYGGFYKSSIGSKELGKYILSCNYDEVELIGVCTGICVLSNACIIKASCPESKIIVDSNCCACVTPETHKNALKCMKLLQIEVR